MRVFSILYVDPASLTSAQDAPMLAQFLTITVVHHCMPPALIHVDGAKVNFAFARFVRAIALAPKMSYHVVVNAVTRFVGIMS